MHKLGNTVWLSDEFQNVAERLFRAMSPDRIEYGPYYINYNELENYYLKYIKIYEEQAANDVDRYAPHLAAILNNMGDLRMYVDNFTEAEDYFNRAGRIYERLSSNAPATWNPRLAASLLKLAEACIFLKKAEASTHIAEALRKCPDLPRCNPLLYIKSFCSLTMPYRYGSKPDYAKAEALCLECLNTFKSLMEEDGKRWGPYAASVLWQLAKIYRVHFGDKERAREAGEEALRMIEGCGDGLLARKVEDRVFRELRRR